MKIIKLLSSIFSVIILLSVILYLNKMDAALGVYPYEAKINLSPVSKKPEFIYLGGSSFKTVGSAPVFADDCIGCGEIGDIYVYHNSESIEQTNYTLKANCYGELDVVQKGDQLNEKGEKIGERCVVVFPKGSARIFFTESEKDHSIISAPSLELVLAFEAGETYKLYKLSLGK